MTYDHKQSIKEIMRHLLLKFGLIDVLNLFRNWRGQKTDHIRENFIGNIFSNIYANGIWVKDKNQDSLSGVGSTRAATDEFVDRFSDFLKAVDCRTLVDIGCGDFNWMRNVQGDFDYLGIDVVPAVIEANSLNYGNDRRRFVCMDATRTAIRPGDVAICREVLFHLAFQDGLKLLRNIKAAGFKYVLLTDDRTVWFNADIRNGDFRRLNLSKAPFGFPQPQREFADDKVSRGRILAVWPGSALPV